MLYHIVLKPDSSSLITSRHRVKECVWEKGCVCRLEKKVHVTSEFIDTAGQKYGIRWRWGSIRKLNISRGARTFAPQVARTRTTGGAAFARAYHF